MYFCVQCLNCVQEWIFDLCVCLSLCMCTMCYYSFIASFLLIWLLFGWLFVVLLLLFFATLVHCHSCCCCCCWMLVALLMAIDGLVVILNCGSMKFTVLYCMSPSTLCVCVWFNKNKFRIDLSNCHFGPYYSSTYTHTLVHCHGIYCRYRFNGQILFAFPTLLHAFHSHLATITTISHTLNFIRPCHPFHSSPHFQFFGFSYCFHFSLASNNTAITSIFMC